MTTVLETCRIAPPAGAAVEELTLPLTFFDILWIHFHPIRRLIFYDHPCSKPDFLEIIIPNLKKSLSLTLKHYLPIAGNLLYPLDTEQKPVIQYVAGDSLPLTIAESCSDFDVLTANHARDSDQFYDLVPLNEITVNKHEHGHKHEHEIVPVMALQVTLFPGRGICIGLSNHHSLGDASSTVGFMWTWAAINKFGGDQEFLQSKKGESLPLFDRFMIKDPLKIEDIFWKVMRQIPFKQPSFPTPTKRVRSTYILHQSDIKKLKGLVSSKNPSLIHVSSFVATTSYVWRCLVKSGEAKVDGKMPEFFVFAVDARSRMEPPVPANYFGNCLGHGMAKVEHETLVGEEGFVAAAEAVALEMKKRVNYKGELLKGAENWLSDFQKYGGMRSLGVSGSPKFDFCNADFGWGKARKMEVLSIDGESYSVSLCNCRDSDGGLEVGVALPKERMDAFAAIFADGLSST